MLGSTFTGGDGVVERKLQSHRGESSNRGAECKAERFPHRGSLPRQDPASSTRTRAPVPYTRKPTQPTERWQKTSDLQKGKKLPPYLGRAKEKRVKKTEL